MSTWWMVSARPAPLGVRQIGERARRQIVDHVDFVTFHQKPVYQGGSDEAGSPGDQCAHQPPFLAGDTFTVDHRSRRNHRPRAQDRYWSDIAPLTHRGAWPHDRTDHLGIGGHMATLHQHRIDNLRP